jgi:hypothetical protein
MIMAIVLIIVTEQGFPSSEHRDGCRCGYRSSANDLRAVASVSKQPRRVLKLLGNPFQVGEWIKVIGVLEASLNHFLQLLFLSLRQPQPQPRYLATQARSL